jgi:hypothetical protein
MGLYIGGKDTTPGVQTNIKALIPGKDYVFRYQAPPIAFAFLSPEGLQQLVSEWLNLSENTSPKNDGAIISIDGVSINTDTGEVFIRGSVAPSPNGEAVNPWAVASVLAALFAKIGVGVSLLSTYETADASTTTATTASSGPTQPETVTKRGYGKAVLVLIGLALFVVLVGRR